MAAAYVRDPVLRVRYLERMELGMPYHEVAERVKAVTRHPEVLPDCRLTVDATGVGRPVVEMLRWSGVKCPVYAVLITSGETQIWVQGVYHVPKKDLVKGVQVLLQNGGLQISAQTPYAEALLEEMMAMEARRTGAGNLQSAVWREGKHDDLVFAVALACWDAQRAYYRQTFGNREFMRRRDQEAWARKFREAMGEVKAGE